MEGRVNVNWASRNIDDGDCELRRSCKRCAKEVMLMDCKDSLGIAEVDIAKGLGLSSSSRGVIDSKKWFTVLVL